MNGILIKCHLWLTLESKVMRENPDTLQAAITVATHKQNLRKRFDLRSGNHTTMSKNFDTEPMEVDHLRPQFRCYKCHRRGHKAKDCRPEKHDASVVSNFARQDSQKWYKTLYVGTVIRMGILPEIVE